MPILGPEDFVIVGWQLWLKYCFMYWIKFECRRPKSCNNKWNNWTVVLEGPVVYKWTQSIYHMHPYKKALIVVVNALISPAVYEWTQSSCHMDHRKTRKSAYSRANKCLNKVHTSRHFEKSSLFDVGVFTDRVISTIIKNRNRIEPKKIEPNS